MDVTNARVGHGRMPLRRVIRMPGFVLVLGMGFLLRDCVAVKQRTIIRDAAKEHSWVACCDLPPISMIGIAAYGHA